jgi:hypothetical protein
VRGPIDRILSSDGDWKTWYPWLTGLKGTNGFVHLGGDWIDKGWPQNPDPGFDYYILSGDSGMVGWDENVANLYNRPVFMLTLPEVYGDPMNDLVTHIPYVHYHLQISKLIALTKSTIQKNILYKASALTSRITQSKCMIFCALYQMLGTDCILTLRNNFDPRNVHDWALTNNKYLDELTECFRENWLHKTIAMVDDDGDPFSMVNPAYVQTAVNFTQESFHYSYMFDESNNREFIYPGPFLTEKTWKCLLSQTAFIPVGQFRSYRWLETMGMQFDYGLDLTFDDDPGNISRLLKLTSLIKDISQYTAADLFEMTEKSSRHNHAIIETGEFFERCERANQTSMSILFGNLLG